MTKIVAVRHSEVTELGLTGFCYSSLLSVAVTRILTKTNLG